jgi:hypothetical protein
MIENNEGINISGGSLNAGQIAVGSSAQAIQNTYINKESQSLAEAAAEIQRLLKQLEETNPTATEYEQVAYVNLATKPTIKQRAITALKDGSETAIDEFVLDNKYLKVIKSITKGWLQPNI